MLDVIFLSYDEPTADENFELLQLFAPHAKRVHGVDGILNAHKECAKASSTNYFYVVDADAVIDELFTFKFTPSAYKEVCHLRQGGITPQIRAHSRGIVSLMPHAHQAIQG